MFAGALHRARPDREPHVPGLSVFYPGPIVLHIPNQLGQRLADGLFPRSPSLDRIQDRSDAIREERLYLLVHPGLGPSGVAMANVLSAKSSLATL
jgi:hypothetical protein